MDGETHTHTLVLIFPAEVIEEVDSRRRGRSRVEVIAEAVWATRTPLPDDDLAELLG